MVFLLGITSLSVFSGGYLLADEVKLHQRLSLDEARCLRELFYERRVMDDLSASDINKFLAETSAGRADLEGAGKRAFIFVIEDIVYCGTAGCLMLIGEQRPDGRCHIISEGNADGGEVILLRQRDHGYRRLYAPCELYFDGRQYQQVREECPTIDVQR